MIAVTSNSLQRNSTLPPLPNAVECAFLEDVTGADFMLSIAPYPCRTPALLQKHIDAGAVLNQHKSGLDLLNSIGERMDDCIARMVEATLDKRTYQRTLIATGIFTWTLRDGKKYVVLNGVKTDTTWASLRGAIGKWEGRGGKYVNLVSDADIPEWCEMTLRHMAEFSASPVKHVYKTTRMADALPDPDLFQMPIAIKDWRNIARGVPGQGDVAVEWLWRVTGGQWGLAQAIMTHPTLYLDYPDRPKSFGEAQVTKNRIYFGTAEGNYITEIGYELQEESA